MASRAPTVDPRLVRGVLAVLAAAIAAAIAVGFLVTRGSKDSSSSEPAAGWRQHEERTFSVRAPAGWQASRDETGRVTLRGGDQTVVIWPVFVGVPLDAAGAGVVAQELAARALPDVTWRTGESADGVVQLVGSSGTSHAVSILTFATSRSGTAASLYAVEAPRATFEQAQPTFAAILRSFTARGEPVAAEREPAYTEWTDPAEGAFSVEVPAGWNVSGGTVRPSTVLVQAGVEATSPDSGTYVLMTDALPLYVEPNDTLAFAGITEGGTYVDPSGYSSPVRSYAPGASYLRDYVVPARAPEGRITHTEDRPDLAAQLATYGLNSYDAGEVEYTFTRNGVRYTGGALAITERLALSGFTAWHVWRLFLVEAPSDRYGEGVAALGRLAGSFRIDPDWAARQSATTAAQVGIISEMGNDISETLSSGYWGRQETYDAIAERRSRATLEVEDVAAPDGTAYRVESGSSYYWIDPRGTIVGTDTHTRPDVDFSELLAVAP